jgi:hypothetical protein
VISKAIQTAHSQSKEQKATSLLAASAQPPVKQQSYSTEASDYIPSYIREAVVYPGTQA